MEQRTVMMVDDQPDGLKPLIEFLEGSGVRIVLAQSGAAALSRLKKFPMPDIILMDALMPEMDGFATCRAIKAMEAAKNIPILYMTALSDTVEKIKGFEAGGVDYLTKPVQHDEVFARIQTHLKIKHLQQELQEKNTVLETKNRQLEELNACKDKFFSILAHDLREPFNSLFVLTELILENIEGWDPQKIKSITQKVQTSAGNLYELLENLLTWSRIQRNMMEAHPQRINLTYLVTQNLSRFEISARKKQIGFHNQIPAELFAYADAQMIDTVLRNLVSNALKFTPSHGTITISAVPDAAMIAVSVADTGIGIPEAMLRDVFRVDVKISRKGTAGETGTGLGLVLCKEFVEQNKGTLNVASHVGEGTTFTFTLPLAQ